MKPSAQRRLQRRPVCRILYAAWTPIRKSSGCYLCGAKGLRQQRTPKVLCALCLAVEYGSASISLRHTRPANTTMMHFRLQGRSKCIPYFKEYPSPVAVSVKKMFSIMGVAISKNVKHSTTTTTTKRANSSLSIDVFIETTCSCLGDH